MTSVSIPETVTAIASYAFYSCSISSVCLPEGVTVIGHSAFESCGQLASVTLPGSLEDIGVRAFAFCPNLEGFSFSTKNPYIYTDGIGLYLDDPDSPEEEYKLCAAAPAVCTNAYMIPDGVTRIEDGAFSECDALTSITIPESVTYIGWYAFADCDSLKELSIPDSVRTIEQHAFLNCTSLASVKMPKDITEVNAGVFEACISLESIEIPDGVTWIGSSAFEGCWSLVSVKIPDSVETIKYRAFEWCENLAYISIPSNVQVIGEGAFVYCEILTSVFVEGNFKVDFWSIDCIKPFGESVETAYYPAGADIDFAYLSENAFANPNLKWVAVYDMIEGEDAEFTVGGEVPAVRADCEVEKFVGIAVDGEAVAEENYAVSSGSTIIEFTKEYLNTLTVGEHKVEMAFTDGVAYSTLTVKAAVTEPTEPTEPEPTEPEPTDPEPTQPEATESEPTQPETTEPSAPTQPADPDNPKTGDSANPLLFTGLILVSLAAIAVIFERKRLVK